MTEICEMMMQGRQRKAIKKRGKKGKKEDRRSKMAEENKDKGVMKGVYRT